MADLRPILSWLATADDAAIAAVMKMATEPKPTIVVGIETFVLIPGVGYILHRQSGCKIIVKDGCLAQIGNVTIVPNAKISEVTPTGMVLRGPENSVHLTFVKHGEHRRVARLEILPHHPTVGAPSKLVGHNIILFDEFGRHVSWEIRGNRETVRHVYLEGDHHATETIRGTRVEIKNSRSGAITKLRRLHPDVTYSAGVFTIATPEGPANVVAVTRRDGSLDTLVIKGLVYKFWIKGVCRRFRVVGEGKDFTLEEIA